MRISIRVYVKLHWRTCEWELKGEEGFVLENGRKSQGRLQIREMRGESRIFEWKY